MKSTTQKTTKEAKASKTANFTSSVKSHSASPNEEAKSEAKKEKLLNKELKICDWKRRGLIAYTLIGVAILVVIFGFLLNYLATPVSIILWTVVIVFLLRGIVSKLEKHGVNRVLGTAIAYLIMIAIVAAVVVFMFSPALGFGEQVKNIVTEFPSFVTKLQSWFSDLYGKYAFILQNDAIKDWIDNTIQNIGGIGTDIAAASAGGIIAAGGAIGTSFMAVGIALVIAFWILIELPKLGREVNRLIKPKYREDAEMWHYIFTHVMAGYIKGTFLQCLIIGVAAGIWFAILQIPNAAALGCITGVLNIIPIIGPWIGGAVAGLGGLFTHPIAALLALAGTIAIQQFVYTFISPKIMSSSVDIHPALSLFALTVGAAIGGAMSGMMGSLVGMLLSIPAVAVFKSLFVYYFEKRTKRRIVAPDGVFFAGAAVGDEKAKPMIDAVSPSVKVLRDAFSSPEKMKRYAKRWKLNDEAMQDLEEMAKISKAKYEAKKLEEQKKKATRKRSAKKKAANKASKSTKS